MNGMWEADAVGFAGSSKWKFSIAVLLPQWFPSCTSRAEVKVSSTFSPPYSHPGGCSWGCVMGTETSAGLRACVRADVLGKRVWDLMGLSRWLKVPNQVLNWLDSSRKLVGILCPVCLQYGQTVHNTVGLAALSVLVAVECISSIMYHCNEPRSPNTAVPSKENKRAFNFCRKDIPKW